MHTFELLLGLSGFCLILAAIAQRLKLPFAVTLVLGGMVVAFVPRLPKLEFEPELALALFLPPLLQLSAYRTDWPAFRANLRPILLLAVGAVLLTAVVVALVAKWLVPDLPWGAAIALGAIVAPPDAVAAASVLKTLKPPKHIVTVLEGESLLNDASSLVLYRFAVAATVAGSFDWKQGALSFVLAALGGAAIGYAVGRIAMWVFAQLEDTAHDIMVSILAGFVAYFAAEFVHASGVLGVVVCGLVLGRQQHLAFTAETRLTAAAVWRFVEFVLTSLVFMLIGMQLRGIIERLDRFDPWQLGVLGLAVSAALIVSRFVWIFPTAWLPRRLSPSLRERDPMMPWNELFVLSWAGMRGVVSLAAALALPMQFPGRDLIVFLAFCAIFATLVMQGTTLGPLIRHLGVMEPETEGPSAQQLAVRQTVTNAALGAVEGHLDDPERREVAQELLEEYRAKADQAGEDPADAARGNDRHADRLRLRLESIEASRDQLSASSDEHDETARQDILEELDLEEQKLRRQLGERD